MFEDKRFKNDIDNNSNNFFMPDNSTGLRDGNDNLNFGEQPVFKKVEKQKKKRKSNKVFLKLFLILLIFSLLGGGIYLVYISMFNNPYKIYKNVINYGFDYLNARLIDIKEKKLEYDVNKDILSSSFGLEINSNLLEQLNGFEYKYKLTTDLNKKMIDSNLIVNKDSKEVLNIDGFLRDNNIIINSKNIYDKYLQVSTTDNIDFNSLNFNDNILSAILVIIKNVLIDDLDKNKMNIEKTKIEVQGRSVKVLSNNYKLNSNDVKKIYQDVIDALINDNTIIDSLADMLSLRKAEIKEKLKSLANNELVLNSFKDLEFKIYSSGITNKVIGFKILFNKKEIVSYIDYKNVLNINSSVNNNKIYILKNSKETKLNYTFNNGLISIIITKKEDITNFEFSIEVGKMEIDGNLEVEIKRVANKKITTNVILEVNGINDKDSFNINLKFGSIIQVGGTILNIPKSNIVNYEELNDYQKREIDNRFKNILNNMPFKDLFNNEESTNYCDIATNCECFGSICTCYYIDNNGVEQSINCLNKSAIQE